MEIQENNLNSKLFFMGNNETIEKPTNEPKSSLHCMKNLKEKFRSEGRKSDIQLKLEQKRFIFLNASVCEKYEEEILKFFDGFTETKTQPKILINRLLEILEKAENLADENKILENLKIIRKLTCIPKNELVLQEIVLSKVMEYLFKYLDCNFREQNKIENEILWIYINLTSLSQSTNTLLDFTSIISKIMSRLTTNCDQNKIEMIFWFFYNLCVDNLIYRKKLLENGIVDYIMRVWNELLLTETCKHNLIELVLALSQEKKLNAIYYQEIIKLFPIIEICFQENTNNEDLIDILWIIKHLTDENNNNFERVLSMPNFDKILNLLMNENLKLVQISLKIINNLLSGENQHIKFLMEKNIMEIFNKLIFSDSLSIRREVCFGISNICAASKEQIDQLFQNDLLNEMIKLGFIDDISVKMEIGIALSNLCIFANKKQQINLVNRGVIEIWNDLLSQFQTHDEKLILRILVGLQNILQLGEEIEDTIGANPIKINVENTDIPKILDAMQDHPNDRIYKASFRILDKYFKYNECDDEF